MADMAKPNLGGAPVKFPRSFVYHSKIMSSTSSISSEDGTDLFTVDTGTKFGIMRRKQIILYDGVDKSMPVLGVVEPHKSSRVISCVITVDHQLPGGPVQVTMAGDSGDHAFSLPVQGTEEGFEWCYCNGVELEQLSGDFNKGWKLVRVNKVGAREVVAVAAHPRWRKLAPFRFIGSGASGDMGETFEIAAVLGYLRLYALTVDRKNAEAATLVAIT